MSPPTPARLWRTLRRLRGDQARAQLRHRLRGAPAPRPWVGEAPELGVQAPRAPFLHAPPHARYEGEGTFDLLNREVEFRQGIDWDYTEEGPLWAFHLHQFDYLRAPHLDPRTRTALLLDWIERHPRGVGWLGHPLSLRTMNWLKLLLTPGAFDLNEATGRFLRASLGQQLQVLAARPETHLLANHYLSNLLALVFAGIVLDGPAAERWRGLQAALRVELAEQVLADGAHFERSPMYHALLLEAVLDLANVAAASARTPEGLEETLRETAARMLGALRVWTHPDGRIALFGDSALGIAQEPATLERYAAALGIAVKEPARDGLLERARFVRLAAGPFHAIATFGDPSPDYQPGHSHADALSFELSLGSQRVVTDTGVAEYVRGAYREASRATRSHATLEIDGRDQAECWHSFRVGGRPRVELLHAEPDRVAEGTCASWATPQVVHRRRFRVDERTLQILDAVEGRPHRVRLTLPLAPGLEPELSAEVARLRLPEGRRLEIALPRGVGWRVERRLYFPEFGRVVERAALVGEGARLPSSTWLFRFASS